VRERAHRDVVHAGLGVGADALQVEPPETSTSGQRRAPSRTRG
jgi:hypothetical protein